MYQLPDVNKKPRLSLGDAKNKKLSQFDNSIVLKISSSKSLK
jgi:hypothetical protein